MKFTVLLIISFCLTGVQVAGQHPLVGTWEMASVKGIDADGVPFFYDTASVKETKIITPTHYMLIAWDVEGDSLIFNRTIATMFLKRLNDGISLLEIIPGNSFFWGAFGEYSICLVKTPRCKSLF